MATVATSGPLTGLLTWRGTYRLLRVVLWLPGYLTRLAVNAFWCRIIRPVAVQSVAGQLTQTPTHDFMDCDDVVFQVLVSLVQGAGTHAASELGSAAMVNHRFSRLANLDVLWRPICEQRWQLHVSEPAFLEAAVAAAAATRSGTVWRDAYRVREAELLREYPVFFMGPTSLEAGRPIGLHLVSSPFREQLRGKATPLHA